MICPSPRPPQLWMTIVNIEELRCRRYADARINVEAILGDSDVRVLFLHDELEKLIMSEVIGGVIPAGELSGDTNLDGRDFQ